MATLSFSIPSASFDLSLLPSAARTVGTTAHRDAVNAFLQREFRDFGGNATIRVDDQSISVTWNPDTPHPNLLEEIIEQLKNGRRAEGIQLLELLLSNCPDDPAILYNLGIALSDEGRLERAEQCLRRATEINPKDVNAKVALGVALGRLCQNDDAIMILQQAVQQDENNPWAHRNLGAMLLKTDRPTEAIAIYQRTVGIQPNDQVAWLGLADAFRLTNRIKEAESAYRTAVEINPHNDVAELARAGSNALAQSSFAKSRETIVRQDVVQYCLSALQRFSKMDEAELKKLTLEMAMIGRNGLEVHNPNSRYHIKGLSGDFSGLALVCYLFVAMQRIAPGTDVGFDVRKEYELATKLFASQQ